MPSSTNKPVTVLLPYWGEFKLLQKAVDSVLAQTDKNWKLIIIDDHYPEKDAQKLYASFPDDRITYLRNEKNLGLVENYNYALRLTKTEYCVIMGCDDQMLPAYLETARKNIGKADYYQPGVRVINENDTPYLPATDRLKQFIRPKKQGIHSGESLAASLCHGNWTYFPSLFWKTATLKKYGFNKEKPNTQDLLTQIDIICGGGSLHIDNTVTFQYRRSAQSFSSKAKSGTRFSEEDTTFTELAERFRTMGWKRAARAATLHITTRIHKIVAS